MEKSSNATELVRDHFREKASSFDALYDEEHLVQRAVRPGLLKRRDFAIDVVREYEAPRVLDIGGGSGRVGELALEAGAGEYVNADIAQEMLDLSKERLARFGDKVKLVHGDFMTAPLEGITNGIVAVTKVDAVPDERVADELGDLFFAAVNVARRLNVDPELELRRASERFVARVEKAEQLAADSGEHFAELDLGEQDRYFDRAKEEL